MLSLAMIRVEPGSTPGIGITITEPFFFGFFVFCGMFVAFRKGNCSSGVGSLFRYCYSRYVLGFGVYILHHQVRQSR